MSRARVLPLAPESDREMTKSMQPAESTVAGSRFADSSHSRKMRTVPA